MGFSIAGCEKEKTDLAAEAPPPTTIEHETGTDFVKVDHPEQFPLATAGEHDAAPELNVTGTVSPDISRTVPVISLASGRVVDVRARLGDEVRKGQLLLQVRSADISGAFSDYRKAVADEQLARSQFERSKLLYEKGAISQNDLQVAQDTEDKAAIDIENTEERLRVLGASTDHPSGIIDIYAPVSGVITDQQVTTASGVLALSSSNPFTIADLSHVWILCDVNENNLPFIQLGEYVDVHLDAYPEQLFKGRVGNIGPILDPGIRTAKVRLELPNPGRIRPGMFVTATFYGKQKQKRATVPASAVLHLHDRDWVYVPVEGGRFKRVEVTGGNMLLENMQEIVSGIAPGAKVVSNALDLQNTVEQ